MIKFVNNNLDAPYVKFKEEYERAVSANQKIVEAITISSYSKLDNLVDSRYVNLKIVDNKEFIFFSNYNSPKSKDFNEHNQMSALFFWSSIKVQIRLKGVIKKTTKKFNKEYFAKRDVEKNALAISSNQSKPINSYNIVIEKYQNSLNNDDLKLCPNYWGGFSFKPYYFEFLEVHSKRLNKRESYLLQNNKWHKEFLEP